MNEETVVILDGGMGKELHRIGAPFRQPEWSALPLMEDPDAVTQAHRNFVAAGAEVITVNSYAVVPFHIGDDRFVERGRELVDLAGRLAREAADEAPHPVRVAGSLPPMFGSYLADKFDPEAAPSMLAAMVEAQAPWVDLWIGETIGSCAEAEAMVEALRVADAAGERWLSFALAQEVIDDRPTLWSGESVGDGAKTAMALGADAVLLNCASPETISLALPELVAGVRAAGGGARIGVYANALPTEREEDYAANAVVFGRREELTEATYADLAGSWIAEGASIVGGCCGVHPEHVGELANRYGSASAQ